MKHAVKRIHFVGVGGVGMCGIAEVLHNLGYQVSGSDMTDSASVRHLRDIGVQVFVGHEAAHVQAADVVVTSTAIPQNNPEVATAREQRIPVVPRATMLAELMRFRQGIAVAGTHGKTTTTSLIASVLAEGGLDPTFVIGGRLSSVNANARLGSGEHIVVEADESDASFLKLSPVMTVVTNIDADHMETYAQDFEVLKKAFLQFLLRMPFYGLALVCTESPAVRDIQGQMTCKVMTYGFDDNAQLQAVDVRAVGGQMHFTLKRRNGRQQPDLAIQLNLAGKHNVLNALAAIGVAMQLGVGDADIQRALATFRGVDRRFQHCGNLPAQDGGEFALVDDYGHHPTEIAATIEAARGMYPGRRLVLVFQPHRYTRTRDCFDDFVEVLGRADAVLLTEVYAAGEKPLVAADGRALARALRVAGKTELVFVEDVQELPHRALDFAQAGDVILCLGAGSIGQFPARLVALSKEVHA